MAVKKPAKPLASRRTHCPITGELIKIVKAGDMWLATTSLWTSRPFHSEDRLQYELSYNAGIAPDLPDPSISARPRLPPQEPVGVTPEERAAFS